MKRYFWTLGMVTFSLIIITGIYIWINNKDHTATLGYIPDDDWSKRHIVLKEIGQGIYDVDVDDVGEIHIIHIDFDRKDMIGKLYYTGGIDETGKISNSPNLVISDKRLIAATLSIFEDKLYIYWIGQGNGKRLNLYCTIIDKKGDIHGQKIIYTSGFTNARDLIAEVSADGKFLLVWTDVVEGIRQVKKMMVDSSGLILEEPEVISTINGICSIPKLEVDKYNNFHLVWKVEKVSNQNELKVSQHFLFYQPFDGKGHTLINKPIIIDEIVPNAIGVALSEDSLYLSWNKIVPVFSSMENSNLEKLFPNYVIFGTTINLKDPNYEFEIKRLTQQRGPSFNLGLTVESGNLVHLVYMDAHTEELALTHEIYDHKLINQMKPPTRIYPDQKLISDYQLIIGEYKTFLLSDPIREKGIHCAFIDTDSEGYHLYYANTINPEKVSPFQIIGINGNYFGINLFMSFAYILSVPMANIVGFLHLLFIFIISGVLIIIANVFSEKKIEEILKNNYVGWILIVISHYLLYLQLGMRYSFFWPAQLSIGQEVFSIILSSIGALVFIGLNKNKRGLYYAGFAALYWIYWINMIGLMFVLAQVNYA